MAGIAVVKGANLDPNSKCVFFFDLPIKNYEGNSYIDKQNGKGETTCQQNEEKGK